VDLLEDYNPDRYMTLGQYQNLTVTASSQQVTDEQVEQALEQVLYELGTEEKVTDAAKAGDKVNIDYQGTVDGKADDTFTDTDTTLTLGENSFVVEGMEEALLGVKAGQTVTVSLKVQEDYFYADYVGKTVAFTVKVNWVTRVMVPTLNDQLAQKLGDYQTAEEFKTAFAKQYRTQIQDANTQAVRNDLWQKVVDNAVVERYPYEALEQHKAQFRRQAEENAKEYEMPFSDYISYAYGALDEESFDAYATEYCQMLLKHEMVLRALCKKEAITLSDTEYETYYAKYLSAYEEVGATEEDMIADYGTKEDFRNQFLMEKAVDLIEKTATIQFADQQ
jgi:trigger factor